MIKKKFIDYLYKMGVEAMKKRESNLRKICDVNPNAFYLDCGCYTGELTMGVAKKINTKKVFGIDRDLDAMKIARKRGIDVISADLNGKLPFKNETFDVVTAVEVIEHLHDTDMFMNELYRVTKKGGYAIIATENLASWHNIFALLLGLQPSTGPHISQYYPVGFQPLYKKHLENTDNPDVWNFDKHINVITRDALRKLSIAYKFKIENEKNSGFYPFSGYVADLLANFDRRHALTVLLKLRKE